MLKGSIDKLTADQVSGWAYSESGKITGRRILAFIGERCIGAGEVGLLRADLRDAGLGDGKLGFEFAIDAGMVKELEQVHLRLENSDFCLFQTAFHQNIARENQAIQELYTEAELARVEWMNRQGWLTNEQYLGVKALNTLGVYQRTFSKAELAQENMAARAPAAYCELIGTLLRQEISEEQLEISLASDLIISDAPQVKHREIIGVFGDTCEVSVAEGSHGEIESPAEAITYKNAAHQLLLVHATCLKGLKFSGKGTVHVIRARR